MGHHHHPAPDRDSGAASRPRGRDQIATYGSRPLGAALGALVGGLYGAETALVVAAVGFLIQAGVILASPVRRLVGQPQMASE